MDRKIADRSSMIIANSPVSDSELQRINKKLKKAFELLCSDNKLMKILFLFCTMCSR